jgi:hypothetical protein
MGQPLVRVEVTADEQGMKVRLVIAPSILYEVYARDGLGLFDREKANLAVRAARPSGRPLPRETPLVVEFSPGSEDADEYAPKFRPGSPFELSGS